MSHLPEGQENHHLDDHEFQEGVEGGKQFVCAHIEQHEGIQSQCVRDVVDDCDPEVSAHSQQAHAKHSQFSFGEPATHLLQVTSSRNESLCSILQCRNRSITHCWGPKNLRYTYAECRALW